MGKRTTPWLLPLVDVLGADGKMNYLIGEDCNKYIAKNKVKTSKE
jgi:hypothetical protein